MRIFDHTFSWSPVSPSNGWVLLGKEYRHVPDFETVLSWKEVLQQIQSAISQQLNHCPVCGIRNCSYEADRCAADPIRQSCHRSLFLVQEVVTVLLSLLVLTDSSDWADNWLCAVERLRNAADALNRNVEREAEARRCRGYFTRTDYPWFPTASFAAFQHLLARFTRLCEYWEFTSVLRQLELVISRQLNYCPVCEERNCSYEAGRCAVDAKRLNCRQDLVKVQEIVRELLFLLTQTEALDWGNRWSSAVGRLRTAVDRLILAIEREASEQHRTGPGFSGYWSGHPWFPSVSLAEFRRLLGRLFEACDAATESRSPHRLDESCPVACALPETASLSGSNGGVFLARSRNSQAPSTDPSARAATRRLDGGDGSLLVGRHNSSLVRGSFGKASSTATLLEPLISFGFTSALNRANAYAGDFGIAKTESLKLTRAGLVVRSFAGAAQQRFSEKDIQSSQPTIRLWPITPGQSELAAHLIVGRTGCGKTSMLKSIDSADLMRRDAFRSFDSRGHIAPLLRDRLYGESRSAVFLSGFGEMHEQECRFEPVWRRTGAVPPRGTAVDCWTHFAADLDKLRYAITSLRTEVEATGWNTCSEQLRRGIFVRDGNTRFSTRLSVPSGTPVLCGFDHDFRSEIDEHPRLYGAFSIAGSGTFVRCDMGISQQVSRLNPVCAAIPSGAAIATADVQLILLRTLASSCPVIGFG
jgi:hypothetical protein